MATFSSRPLADSSRCPVDQNMILSDSTGPLIPSWQGYIASTTDALVIIEAYLLGIVNGIPRRPRYAEHHSLIKSGSVVIFEERSSGIKRWTDGLKWGPSRVLGNFLIYRELDDASNPIRKSTAKPRTSSRSGRKRTGGASAANVAGSFGDWYQFKQDGLVKKTISVSVQERTLHLVSYFTMEDVMLGRLLTPTVEPGLAHIVPRMDLFRSESIRKPIDGADHFQHSESPAPSSVMSMSRPAWETQQWEFLHHLTAYQPIPMYSPHHMLQ